MGRYNGMAYPFGNTLKSYFSPKSDRDILRSSIINILFTNFYERVAFYNFGSELPRMPFSMMDEITEQELRDILVSTVPMWDPRIQVVDVSVIANEQDPKLLHASVVYRDVNDPTSESSVQFPLTAEYRSVPTYFDR